MDKVAEYVKAVLLFAVTGCPTLQPPADGWVKQTGHNAFMGCEQSVSTTWKLSCNGTTWVGEKANCTPPGNHFILYLHASC